MSRTPLIGLGLALGLVLVSCDGDDVVDVDLSVPVVADLSAAVDFADGGDTPTGPYAVPGSAAVTMTLLTASLGGEEYTITAYVPSTAGARPVVVVCPGYAQPGVAYAPYAERLASYGILVLLRDDPGSFTSSPAAADQLTDEIATWLPAQSAGGPLAGKLDLTKVGLLGHERGGQIALMAATGGLAGKVVAYFGLDPVDSMANGATVRAAVPSLAAPSVFMGETADEAAVAGSTACAPAADDYQVLFAAAPSPSLQLTANGAALFDFEAAASAVGAADCQSGTADPQKVLAMAVTLSTGFFARELLGDPVGANLDGASAETYIASGQLARVAK